MDFRKTILYFALAILGVMLWHAWQHDYAPVTPVTANATQSSGRHPVEFAPTASDQGAPTYQATPKKRYLLRCRKTK